MNEEDKIKAFQQGWNNRGEARKKNREKEYPTPEEIRAKSKQKELEEKNKTSPWPFLN